MCCLIRVWRKYASGLSSAGREYTSFGGHVPTSSSAASPAPVIRRQEKGQVSFVLLPISVSFRFSCPSSEVAQLLDTRDANCEKITLVCDSLNMHSIGAFYGALSSDIARAYVKRLDFVHPQKTRQLAERCRMRTERLDEPVPDRLPHRRTGATAKRDLVLVRQDQRGVD